ncbi:hypothetical protein [Gloeobacter violaceus]|uniref:hypothetical protein n=1 Tax=Gloeobacter violaceus TaxID=33072 RepID=UPI0013E8AF1F|nr:hypothetical protein [Gloeobacter violaceus]
MRRCKAISYLRFPSREPSLFQIPDDPEAYSTAVEAASLEFEPRSVDRGWLSVWKAQFDSEEENIQAGFAARREKQQTLICLRLHQDTLKDAGVMIKHEPDQNTFSCIANMHYCLHLEDQSVRTKLVNVILDRLKSNVICKDDICSRVTKASIIPLLQKAYARCYSTNASIDLSKAQQWAQDALKSSPPS